MKKVIFGILILAMIFFFLNGGPARIIVGILNSRPDTDVTLSPEYNFKAFAGTVWKTKVKVGLVEVKLYTGRHVTYLLRPGGYDPTDPRYMPPAGMQKIIAILPVGTHLQIERLMKDNGIGDLLFVTASLEDGKVVYLDDYLLARNRFTFPGSSDSKNWGVDPDLLEKAE